MKVRNVNGYWQIDDDPSTSGPQGSIGWSRVVAALRASGEVFDDEVVVGLEADHNGLTFKVAKRE